MNNEQFPAPDPSTRVEATGEMQENPLQGIGVPGVEVESVVSTQALIEVPEHMKKASAGNQKPQEEIRSGQVVPVDDSDRRIVMSRPGDPGHAEKVAKWNHDQNVIHAAAHGAEVKGS